MSAEPTNNLEWALSVPMVNDDLATFTTLDAEALAILVAAVGRLLEPIPDPPESRLQMVRIKHEAKVAYRAWLIGGEKPQ